MFVLLRILLYIAEDRYFAGKDTPLPYTIISYLVPRTR